MYRKLSFLFLFLFFSNSSAIAQTENLTTYTVSNPSGKLAVTSSGVTFTSLETRNTNAYIYKDRTQVNDLQVDLNAIVTTSDAFSGETAIWGLSDTPNDTYEDWANGIYLGFYRGDTSTFQMKLGQIAGTVSTFLDLSVMLNLNQTYYFSIRKVGQQITANIYSDAAKTQLVDSVVGTTSLTGNLRYFYPFSVRTLASAGRLMSGNAGNYVVTV